MVSGDGRHFSDIALDKIIKIAAGYGVSDVYVGRNGLMSTPAISHLIRTLNEVDEDSCMGAIILTASHNLGGPDGDFGIKLNMSNGAQALEDVTDAIFDYS